MVGAPILGEQPGFLNDRTWGAEDNIIIVCATNFALTGVSELVGVFGLFHSSDY